MIKYLGIIGFLLLFIYDYNQISWHHKYIKSGFFLGFFLIVAGTIANMDLEISNIWGIVIALVGLLTTIYVLFFALNFDDTYINEEFKVYDKGVYALCRHPGFWTLLLMYVGLWIAYQDATWLWILVVYNSCNLLYIIYQDVFIFIKVFSDYGNYKTYVPFLIPTFESIKNCVAFFRHK
ncbi:MAG: DUF1295 domain-containing protein [Erysipelotrichaceae bacterium]|nr:DUF1295 domain-containing protein [Erysipelotrichaceae bacterium]MDY5251846.1 DUF1295 domain-containing protein [Erysipelotrichaceae bacterium]